MLKERHRFGKSGKRNVGFFRQALGYCRAEHGVGQKWIVRLCGDPGAPGMSENSESL